MDSVRSREGPGVGSRQGCCREGGFRQEGRANCRSLSRDLLAQDRKSLESGAAKVIRFHRPRSNPSRSPDVLWTCWCLDQWDPSSSSAGRLAYLIVGG